MTRKRLSVLVLTVLGVVLAYLGYEEFENRRQQELARMRAAQLYKEAQVERELMERLPHDDIDLRRLPPKYPRSQSAWRMAEKAFYDRVLTKGRFDTLVAPFQVQVNAFSRSLRSLMTAELALAIAADGKSVADPYLVARALGDGERRYELLEIFKLANTLEVSRVVIPYVGHNRQGEMRFTLHFFNRAPHEHLGMPHLPSKSKYGALVASPNLRSRHFEKLAFTDVETPIDVFYKTLPAMLEFLGHKAPNSVPALSKVDSDALPGSPLALAANPAEPARDAYYFQLLAALTPVAAERTRERLNEKSMLAVRRMSADSPDYRALKARALMNMGLRPAALHVLREPASAEEKHLVGLLNGNLPEIEAIRAQISPGVRRVIAALEENAIAAAFRARERAGSLAAVQSMKLPGEVWPFLAARALIDWDHWSQHENIHVKALLDREFPIEGSTAHAMLQGASAIGDVAKLQAAADLSVIEHVRKQIELTSQKSCCEPLTLRPGPSDYLDVLEAVGTDNLVRRARFLALTQGRPQDALQFIQRIESVYKDHPRLALATAHAQMQLAANAQGAEREGLLRGAYTTGFNVLFWEQGQTRAAADALDHVVQRSRRQDFGLFDNAFVNDYPMRSFYPYWQLPNTFDVWFRNAQEALRNSSFDFHPMDRLEWYLGDVRKDWDRFDGVLQSVENRFVGHPRHIKMMAKASLRRGDLAAGEKLYREGIRRLPEDEQLYADLGKLLFENGVDDKSAEVFMSYPGMKRDATQHPVDIANYAYDAGSLYYWIGDLKRAQPLYRRAAELDTGSSSSIASASRLQLIDGDYLAALRGSLERARRYNSSYAYRDYFALLHVMGQSQQAWDGFTLTQQTGAPHVWESVLVGHRLQGADESQVAAWASQESIRSAGNRYPVAAIHLLRAGMTDRTPSAELAKRLAGVEPAVWQLENQYRSVVRETMKGDELLALGPKSPSDATSAFRIGTAKKTQVKSDYVFMAEAYKAMRSADFASARRLLEEASALYDLRHPALGYLLPYYAFAAGKSKDRAAIQAVLNDFAPEYRRFDYHLAIAVLAGLEGRHDEALRNAKLALHRRPFTENRPVFPEYEFAELCEWLFEATREPRYRALAVDWAKKNQVIQPWHAWAYAIEAKLSTQPQERRRAMAMTYYLDRRSERLSRLPQSEVKAAVQEYAGRNPFLRPASPRRHNEKA